MIHMETRHMPEPPSGESANDRKTGRAALLLALLLIVGSIVLICGLRTPAAAPSHGGSAGNAYWDAPGHSIDMQSAFRSDSTIVVQARPTKKGSPCRPDVQNTQTMLPPICLSGILAGLFAHARIHGKDSDSIHLQPVLKNTFMVRAGPAVS